MIGRGINTYSDYPHVWIYVTRGGRIKFQVSKKCSPTYVKFFSVDLRPPPCSQLDEKVDDSCAE